MPETYKPGIGISAGAWMIRWELLAKHIHLPESNGYTPLGEEINVFINFECILKNLALQKGLAGDVTYFKQDVVIEMESAILNLVAHYRGFFIRYYKKVNVYLYYTDLESDLPQEMECYNRFYRSYYKNRYLTNPQFRDMGDVLVKIIIPEVELIMSYIPGCYFVRSRGFDGSLIPYLIGSTSKAQNTIISGDVFDTQYMFLGNFDTIYVKRRFQHFGVMSTIPDVVTSIVKDESPLDLTIFNSEMYFRLLLSIKGSKIRNIKSAKGFGYGRFMNLLKEGLEKDIVLKDFESIHSIAQLFPEKYREDIINAFRCTNLDTQISLTTKADLENIQSQLIDKIDIESVESLNNKRFLSYPIKLMYLLEKNAFDQ